MNLLNFRSNVTSQTGEDGIIAKIFETLKISKGWCVEFGAHDGKTFSNTYNLISKEWNAVLIEGSSHNFNLLKQVFIGKENVTLINSIVGFDSPLQLDEHLSTTSIPINFDFLSIDIDGNDYHVLEAMIKYKPKVFVIEFNPTIPNHISFIQARDMNVWQGCSLKAIAALANLKGYELICCTNFNAFFVETKYFPMFDIVDNSLDVLYDNRESCTILFQGFDGSLHLAGNKRMYWHGITMDEEKLQMLPKEQRVYPGRI